LWNYHSEPFGIGSSSKADTGWRFDRLSNPDLLKILIVDDDEDDYTIIRDMLSEVKEVRYKIDWVDNYQSALETLNEKIYDICLLDFRLGKHNGMELLREIIKAKYRMPVILLTGLKDHDINVEAMNSGAADFIVKGEVNSVILERSIRYSIEHKKMEEKISYQASHDSLTGLINRSKFEEELKKAMEETVTLNLEHCLLYMDLDRFKVVNDTCGHLAGDQLLKQVALHIHDQIRHTDIFARMSGDEFAILLYNCSLANAGEIAANICISVQNHQFICQNYQFNIGISIGIVPITAASSNLDRILSNADEACYLVKDKGGNGCLHYQSDAVESSTHKNELLWVLNINRAFVNNLFRLQRQPVIPLTAEAKIVHYELLIRMLDENDQLVLPNNFLPTATHYKLMSAIDRWVVKNYFAFYREQLAQNRFVNTCICNINLSGSFLNEEDSLQFLLEQINHYQIPPQHLCFEITETSAIANFNHVIAFVEQLKARGCRFALDDFGNGLATFNYLKKFPVDFVKIDGSFVRNILSNPIDCSMVESINQIAHLMKIKTVAEFVENEAIFRKLKEIGIDYAQGYWIGKPQPLETLPNSIRGRGLLKHRLS
jgi:diguanylate cyclase (GGDEF)-like protein